MAGEMYTGGAGSAGDLGNSSGDGTQTPTITPEQRAESDLNDWKNQLPEEMRSLPVIKDIKSIDGLVKVYADQAKHLGNSIRKPGEHATEAEKADFVSKLEETGLVQRKVDQSSPEYEQSVLQSLGVPEKAADYQVPDGIEGLDQNWLDNTKELAHQVKLTPKQLQDFLKISHERGTAAVEANKQERSADIASLHQKWGADMSRRIDIAADFAAKTEAPQTLLDAINSGNADSSTLQWLYNQAVQTGSEGSSIASQGYGAPQETPDQHRAEITQLEERMGLLDRDESLNQVERREQQAKITSRIIELRQLISSQAN